MKFDIERIGPYILAATSLFTAVLLYMDHCRKEEKFDLEIELQRKQLDELNAKLDGKLNKSF